MFKNELVAVRAEIPKNDRLCTTSSTVNQRFSFIDVNLTSVCW